MGTEVNLVRDNVSGRVSIDINDLIKVLYSDSREVESSSIKEYIFILIDRLDAIGKGKNNKF